MSIICVYNNKSFLEKYLLKSLKNQNKRYDLHLLENTHNQFKSAAEAFNYGGKEAKGRYLMFVHQDIIFDGKNWLERCEKMLDSIERLGVAGVAGMSEAGKTNYERGRNIILETKKKTPWRQGNKIHAPEEIQTLDECLIIIPQKIFKKYPFDEKTCDHWHLYSVDYCLSIKKKGYRAMVLPLLVTHISSTISTSTPRRSKLQVIFSLGWLSEDYYRTLKKILKKHRKKYKMIYTTCGDWNTRVLIIFQRIYKVLRWGVKAVLLLKNKK